MQGLAHISSSPKSHCTTAGTRPGKVAPVQAVSFVGGQEDFHSPPHPPRNQGWHRSPRPCRGGRGGDKNPAAATWAPSARSPHPLFPTGPGSGSSFGESPRRGGQGAWRSYFRAIPAGGRRAGGAWRWRQSRRPSVCFYFIQQKVLFVEVNRRWGLELEGAGKGKKATSTTTLRSSPELPRGGE